MDAAPSHPLRLRIGVPRPKQLHFPCCPLLTAENPKHTGDFRVTPCAALPCPTVPHRAPPCPTVPPTTTTIMLLEKPVKACFLILSPRTCAQHGTVCAISSSHNLFWLLRAWLQSRGSSQSCERGKVTSITMQAAPRRQKSSCHHKQSPVKPFVQN